MQPRGALPDEIWTSDVVHQVAAAGGGDDPDREAGDYVGVAPTSVITDEHQQQQLDFGLNHDEVRDRLRALLADYERHLAMGGDEAPELHTVSSPPSITQLHSIIAYTADAN